MENKANFSISDSVSDKVVLKNCHYNVVVCRKILIYLCFLVILIFSKGIHWINNTLCYMLYRALCCMYCQEVIKNKSLFEV